MSLWFEIVLPFHKHLPLYSFDLAIPTSQSTLDMSGFVASSCLLRQINYQECFKVLLGYGELSQSFFTSYASKTMYFY